MASASSSAAPSSLALLTNRIASRWGDLTRSVSRLYRRASPALAVASDYAWFLGSSALLLSLPILVELQREATVLVLQRQREAEVAQMQEQARAMNASTLDNLRATASMMLGGGPPPPPGAADDRK